MTTASPVFTRVLDQNVVPGNDRKTALARGRGVSLPKNAARVFVPMSFAGEGFDPSSADPKKQSVETIHNIYIKPGMVNMDPPYQRNACWTPRQEVAFIESIFNEMVIPPLYLVKRAENEQSKQRWTVLDGKQRLKTMTNFFQDKIKIDIKFVDDKEIESIRSLNYSQIKRFADPNTPEVYDERVFDIFRQFMDLQIGIVIFEPMGLEQQKMAFEALNNGTAFSKEERRYCPNYLARLFYEDIYDRVYANLSRRLPRAIRTKIRFKNVTVIHDLLSLVSGPDFTSKPGEKPQITGDDLKRQAARLHTILLTDIKWNYKEGVSDALINQLGLTEAVKTVTAIANAIDAFFEKYPSAIPDKGRRNTVGKHDFYEYEYRTLNDMILHIMMLGDKFPLAYFKEREKQILVWMKRYYEERTDDPSLNKSVHPGQIMNKTKIAHRLFFDIVCPAEK